MTKLNQIVAIEKGVKTDSQRTLTEAYHALQNPTRFTGIAREYEPKADDGEHLPPESTLVQVQGEKLLDDIAASLTRMWDTVATKDETNTTARADIKIEDMVLAADVPVTTLLWLEKQLVDLHTFVGKLPLLDPGKEWQKDPATDVYRANPVQSLRNQKVLRNHVVAEATDKHPAQVTTFTEDVPVGTWTTTHFSGAFPASRQNDLLERITMLQNAVKFAREAANTVDVQDKKIGESILSFLLES